MLKRIAPLVVILAMCSGFIACTTSTEKAEPTDTGTPTTDSGDDTGTDDTASTDEDEATDTGTGTGSENDTGEEKPPQLTGNPCEAGGNPWTCDPLTSDECTNDGHACHWGDAGGVQGMVCLENSTAAEGAACSAPNTRCGPGLGCYNGICARYCCSDADCDGTGETCNHHDIWSGAIIGGEFGLCFEEQKTGDICGGDNPWECDPLTAEGCEDGQACELQTKNGIKKFVCLDGGTNTATQSCSFSAMELCGPGLSCYEDTCTPYCCSDADCSPTQACRKQATLAPNYTGGTLGLCIEQTQPCPGECTLKMDGCSGIVFNDFYRCADNDIQGCCLQMEEPWESDQEACPTSSDGDTVAGFECQNAATATFTCKAIHHYLTCPDKAGKSQWCCELDPDPVAAFQPETDTDTETQSDTQTDTDTETQSDTQTDMQTDTDTETQSDTQTDTQTDTDTETQSDTRSDSDA